MKFTTAVFMIAMLIISATSGITYARADTPAYAYADLDGTAYFCSEKNYESALFVIPETYCVKILADEGQWYYVKYAEDSGIYRAVYGYCMKSDLKPIASPLENEYLNLSLKIKFTAESGSPLIPPIETEITSAYYGEYIVGKTTLSYVLCADKFGYVPQLVENYPLNELPKPTVAEPSEKPDGGSVALITAIVITVIAVVAIVALYFTSKKRPL